MNCEYGVCPILQMQAKVERLTEIKDSLYRRGYEYNGEGAREFLDARIAEAEQVQHKIDDLIRERDSFVSCGNCNK